MHALKDFFRGANKESSFSRHTTMMMMIPKCLPKIKFELVQQIFLFRNWSVWSADKIMSTAGKGPGSRFKNGNDGWHSTKKKKKQKPAWPSSRRLVVATLIVSFASSAIFSVLKEPSSYSTTQGYFWDAKTITRGKLWHNSVTARERLIPPRKSSGTRIAHAPSKNCGINHGKILTFWLSIHVAGCYCEISMRHKYEHLLWPLRCER